MNFGLSIFAAFLVAFIIALAVTPLAIKIAPKIGAIDVPKDGRRMHTAPVPRFGGIAIFSGTMISIIAVYLILLPNIKEYWLPGEPVEKLVGILVGGTLIYLVGVYDDLRGMPAKAKFLAQAICGAVVWGFGIRITFITNHLGDGHGYLGLAISFIVTVIWIVGITNTINLIDGLDGLAAGVATIASCAIAYVAYIHGMYTVTMAMLALAGGALGFLPYNFNPARIFMGDGGSLFLGFMLASVSIIGPVKGATIMATAVPVLVLALPIFDTAYAIFRRLINKRPIMEADKGHLHHRMIASGMGQRRSVIMLYGISGVMGVAAIIFSRDLFLESAGLLVLALMFIFVFLSDSNRRYSGDAINIKAEESREKRKNKKGNENNGDNNTEG